MPEGLNTIVRPDLSRGMFPGVAPELIPQGGAFDILNGLLDEDGVAYRRGGAKYASPFNSGRPRMLWSGYLKNGGQQTIVASDTGTYRLNTDGTLTSLGFTVPGRPGPSGVGETGIARGQVFQGTLFLGSGHIFDGTTHTFGVSPTFQAVAGNRVLQGQNSRVNVSEVPEKEGDGLSFPATNYFSLPGGVRILGMQGFRNACVVLTTEGIWVLSGLEHNIVDADGNTQWRQDLYAPQAVCWGDAGVAAYQGGLVVPCKDDIYVMELGVSSEAATPFVNISQAIQALYRRYVAAGYEPGGGAVFMSHYFLPIVSPTGTVVDTLVCRLDARDSRGRRTYPWSHLTGYGARVAAYAVTDREAALLGLYEGVGRPLRADTYFTPNTEIKDDPDGSTHAFSVTYPDIPTGNLVENTVTKARLRYRMIAPSASYLKMEFGSTAFGTAKWDEFSWDEAVWAGTGGDFDELEGHAPPDPGALKPFTWHPRRKVRFARVKVSQVGPSSSTSIRSLELAVRLDGRRW